MVLKHKVGKTNSPMQNSNFSFKVKHRKQSSTNQQSLAMSSQMSLKALANQGDLEEDDYLKKEVLSDDETTLAVAAEVSASSQR